MILKFLFVINFIQIFILYNYIMCGSQKLIRLTANSSDIIGQQGIFEATFNDGILIEENSQMALLSATLTRSQDSLEVNSFNDLITFKMGPDGADQGLIEVRIAHGKYNKFNFNNLLNSIQDRMNAGFDMIRLGQHFGSQIEVSANTQNKVFFRFKYHAFTKGVGGAIPNNGVGVGTAPWKYSVRQINGVNTPQLVKIQEDVAVIGVVQGQNLENGLRTGEGTGAYMFSSHPFTKGCGDLIVRLHKVRASNDGNRGCAGIFVGLLVKTPELVNRLNTNPSVEERIQASEFAYGIGTDHSGNTATGFSIKIPSQATLKSITGINPLDMNGPVGLDADKDMISLRLTEGQIQYVVHNNNMATAGVDGNLTKGLIIHSEPYVARHPNGDLIDYIPYIGFYGQISYPDGSTPGLTNISVADCSFEKLEVADTEDENILVTSDGEESLGATPRPNASGRSNSPKINIIFNRESLANFLGYIETNLNPNGVKFPLPRIFIAPLDREIIYSTNTYLVELLSEQVDSYDALEEGRKNILCPIPVTDRTLSDGIINYEPNNLFYIDMKNKRKRLIRNMRARIITDSYEPIAVVGLAELNLLIKSPN